MIVEALLAALLGAVGFIVNLLPAAGNLGIEGFGGAVSAMLALDAALPVHEALAMSATCMTILAGIFGTRLVLMLWHAIPGKFS